MAQAVAATVMTAGDGPPAANASRLPRTAAWLFFGIVAVNVMDRQLVAILAESIKLDLDLTDTQVGALSGPLFAVFYAVSGLPLARLADATDRVRVLGLTTAIAGAFAAGAALTRGFAGLALTRVVVAVGDAGGPPSIWSLVSSAEAPERRARTIANIQLGAPAGAVLAFVLGGLVAARFGWRSGFLLVGGLGLALGIAALVFVSEPRRGAVSAENIAPGRLGTLLRTPGFAWGLGGVAFAGMAMFGLGMWAPTVLQREFGWSVDRTGLALGAATAVAGFAGTWGGGQLTAWRRSRGDEGAEFAVPAGAMLLGIPVVGGALVLVSAVGVLACLASAMLFLLAWNAPSIAGFQHLAEDRARAQAAALHVFFVNLLGLGLGPLVIGALSEALTPAYGAAGLRFALVGTTLTALAVASGCFCVAAATMRRATHARRSEDDA